MFKIKTMKLLWSTKIKIAEHEHREYVAYLKITKVILMHCNVVNNIFNKIRESGIHLFLINYLVNY